VQQLLTQLSIAHNRYGELREENLRLKYHTPIVLGLPGPETLWWQLLCVVLAVACCSVAAWAYDRDRKSRARCEQLQQLLAQKETYWRQKLRTFSESAEQLSKLIHAKAFGQKEADGQVGHDHHNCCEWCIMFFRVHSYELERGCESGLQLEGV
jgi:hypothetical protein